MIESIFIVIFIAAICWVAFIFFTKRGKEIMFGGKIIRSFDSVKGKRFFNWSGIKVHAVQSRKNTRWVGLEVSAATIGSYDMIPVSLPEDQAKLLAEVLLEAVEFENET